MAGARLGHDLGSTGAPASSRSGPFKPIPTMPNILSNTDGGLLTKDNCAIAFIDHQPQMLFGVSSIDRSLLINNVVLLAKGAKTFGIPTILTAVETEGFSGYIWPQLYDVFSG